MKNNPKHSYEIFFGTGEKPENGQAKTLCVFLLDTSGSMSGTKINLLNDGLKDFKSDILEGTTLSQRLEVAVVTFDSIVKCLQSPAPVETFATMPTLTAHGGTDMVGGIREAIKIVTERKKYCDEYGIAYRRPWIVMITDGEANVDSIKNQVKQEGKDKRYFFLPIAVDSGSDMNVLNSLATDRAYMLKGLNFSSFFKWLDRSLTIIASIGDNVTLETCESFAV
jgi:uncharacterized protein YegL